MRVGTKSVLFGAHCFAIHPWFVWVAYCKLYGFTLDPRIIMACIVHDIGYWGKPNMDGPEGETHPELGARLMHRLFDAGGKRSISGVIYDPHVWRDFCLCHSRYYSKRMGKPFSRLCVADKLACALTPAWLYVPMVCLTGEIEEYMANGRKASAAAHGDTPRGKALRDIRRGAIITDPWVWFDGLQRYMRLWVEEHKDEKPDEWTSERRAA